MIRKLAVLFAVLAAGSVYAASADISVVAYLNAGIGGRNGGLSVSSQNHGLDAAQSLTITISIPDRTTFDSIDAGTWSCSTPPAGAAGTITCTLPTLGANASGGYIDVRFRVTPQSCGTTSTTATISSATPDPNSANNSSTASDQFRTSDMLIERMSASPATVPPGGDITYTLSLINGGNDDGINVVVTDALPSNLEFVSVTQNVSTPAFDCSHSGNSVTCTTSVYPPGHNHLIFIEARAPANVQSGTTITNTANVSSDSDTNLSNNSASADFEVVTNADLAIVKSISNAPPYLPGKQVAWKLDVSNVGTETASDATVTDTLPPGVTLQSVIAPPSANCSGTTTVTCELGGLTPGASSTLTLITTLPNAEGINVTNTASVANNNGDANPANNTSSVTVPVGLPDTMIVKNVSPPPYIAGQPVTWTLTVSNMGAVAATDVRVVDPIPAGVALQSVSSASATCSGTTEITCALGTLVVGASATIEITGVLPSSGEIVNTAFVSNANGDSNAANNQSTVAINVQTSTPVRRRAVTH